MGKLYILSYQRFSFWLVFWNVSYYLPLDWLFLMFFKVQGFAQLEMTFYIKKEDSLVKGVSSHDLISINLNSVIISFSELDSEFSFEWVCLYLTCFYFGGPVLYYSLWSPTFIGNLPKKKKKNTHPFLLLLGYISHLCQEGYFKPLLISVFQHL